VRDLNARLKAEQKNLERTRKQASPREREPELQRELDRTAEKVRSVQSGVMQQSLCLIAEAPAIAMQQTCGMP
jgi:hypothetical protein